MFGFYRSCYKLDAGLIILLIITTVNPSSVLTREMVACTVDQHGRPVPDMALTEPTSPRGQRSTEVKTVAHKIWVGDAGFRAILWRRNIIIN